MRKLWPLVLALSLIACDQKASAPTAQQIRTKAKTLGKTAEKSIGKAAVKAGEKLQEVGQKAQADAKKSH